MNRFAAILLAALLLAAGCKKESSTPVPATSDLVLYAQTLGSLVRSADALATRTDSRWRLVSFKEAVFRNVGLDIYSKEFWDLIDIDFEKPSTLFSDEGIWVIRGTRDKAKSFDAWLEPKAKAGTYKVDVFKAGDFDLQIISTPQDPSAIFARAVSGDQVSWIPGPRLAPGAEWTSASLAKSFEAWSALESAGSWRSKPWTTDFQTPDDTWPIVGGFRTKSFIDDKTGTDHAEGLWSRMRNQFGPMGVKIGWRSPAQVEILVRTHVDLSEPSFVKEIQGASNLNPEIGGLVVPGVLGVARLSVNPKKTFDLVRSGLPPEQRVELDRFLAQLDETLAIDLVKDVLDNLPGHFIAIIYGFDVKQLQAEGASLYSNLFFLRATREALYVPLKQSSVMENVLDAWTQISPHLSRQRVENSVQYAWVKDNVLSWAILLNQDHMIVVDSTAAFDRALAYQRNPRAIPVADPLIAELLETPNRTGMVLDARGLANLVATGDEPVEWIEEYLGPFRQMQIIGDSLGGAKGEIRLKLELDEVTKAASK